MYKPCSWPFGRGTLLYLGDENYGSSINIVVGPGGLYHQDHSRSIATYLQTKLEHVAHHKHRNSPQKRGIYFQLYASHHHA